MDEDLKRGQNVTRRTVLWAGAAGAAGVTAVSLGLWRLWPQTSGPPAPGVVADGPVPPPAYGDWRDVYRERWRWDKVVRSSHFVNCWYQAHCAWNVYVREGMVWREEQVADYPQTNPYVPDPNPRGCQKGACFSERMYDPGRVRHPLKRVGPRGSGRWKRISWDQALGELADKISERFCKLCSRSGFAENFDALTGEALCDPAYTWTASVFLLLSQRLAKG